MNGYFLTLLILALITIVLVYYLPNISEKFTRHIKLGHGRSKWKHFPSHRD